MKNSLLALALFAFVGTASAHDGKNPHSHGKKGKGKEACTAEAKASCTKAMAGTAGTPSCCMKGGAKATAATKAPVAPAAKSL